MKPQHPIEPECLMLDSLNHVPLIALMEHSTIPWAIKSNDSRFVYINEPCKDFFNIPAGFDFEGRLDEEFPTPWSEMAPEYQAHDRKAEASKEGAEIITTSYFGRDAILEPWYCPKFPLYNRTGDVIGSIFYGKRFNFLSVCDFFNSLKPSVLTLSPPDDTFTEKELDVIFYVLQKLSAKDIALRLCLSHRTVENRLNTIYGKINVNSAKELIEYCHHSGLNCYVPKKLLREGVDFFW
ncbi:helix-turn-helix transcriptional regulator [Martelella alba]|uniref:Helix-turn-helix transcriptional regulator n=1 Tax=Martelella alba TaxID=2590451 RepID=A0ABY2SRB0_9HYPH|nr:PAS and helix-turn-helix domain-containing protein [Martelella alba]TKI08276.1 helix-turn-helix transcriptional regulator [Martelella alba]